MKQYLQQVGELLGMELLNQKMNFSSVDNGWYADMSYSSPN